VNPLFPAFMAAAFHTFYRFESPQSLIFTRFSP